MSASLIPETTNLSKTVFCLAMSCVFLLSGCGIGKDPLSEQLTRAEDLAHAGAVNAVLITLKSAIQDYPDDPEPRYRIAAMYLSLGEGLSAHKEINKAVALGAKHADLDEMLLRSLILTGKADETIARLRENPDLATSAPYQVLYGDAKLATSEIDAAQIAYEDALKLDPFHSRGLLGLARVYTLRGMPAEAKKFAERSVDLDPDNFEAHLLDGELKLRRAEHAAATAAFKTAARLNPFSPIPAIGFARVHWALAENDAALAVIAEARRKLPKLIVLTYFDALAHYQVGNNAAAISLLREVLSAEPEHSMSKFYLAALMYKTGNLQQANELITSFAKRMPNYFPATKLEAAVKMKAGHAEAALDVLSAWPKEVADDPYATALKGSALLGTGATDQGLAMLEQAVSMEPKDDLLATSLILSQIGLGQADAARDSIRAQLASGKDVLQFSILMVHALLQKGEWDLAIEQAEKLLDSYPQEAAVHNAIGLGYLNKKEYDRAMGFFAKAVDLSPKNVTMITNKLLLELQINDIGAARKTLEQLIAVAPRESATLTLRGRFAVLENKIDEAVQLFARARVTDPRAFEARMRLAEHYMKAGNDESAIDIAREAVAISPRDLGPLVLLAEAMLQAGRGAEVAELVDRAVTHFPQAFQAQLLAGSYHLDRGALEEADKFLTRADELSPNNPLIVEKRAALELAKGDKTSAFRLLDALEQVQFRAGMAEELRGDLEMRSENFEAARDHYERSLAQNYATAVTLKAYDAQKRAGHMVEAIADLEKHLDEHPEEGPLRLLLGQYYESVARKEDAIEAYRQVLKVAPNSVMALNNLSALLLDSASEEADALAAQAFELAPNNPQVADTYGWVLLKRGKVRQSLELLEGASRDAPQDGDIRYRYAVALARNGEGDRALRQLDTALEVPQFESRAAAQKLRDGLGRGVVE